MNRCTPPLGYKRTKQILSFLSVSNKSPSLQEALQSVLLRCFVLHSAAGSTHSFPAGCARRWHLGLLIEDLKLLLTWPGRVASCLPLLLRSIRGLGTTGKLSLFRDLTPVSFLRRPVLLFYACSCGVILLTLFILPFSSCLCLVFRHIALF